jgi:MobA/VirD2-like, nuclease domain
MTRRIIDLRSQRPLLDIANYGRRGFRDLTPAQRAHIQRTARRVPEVMVKVSGGARSLRGVREHMKYIGRDGDLGLETDMRTLAIGKGVEKHLIEDWDLDIDALPMPWMSKRRQPPRLVFNLIFSMPPGTPPKKVLQAVRKLADNEWQMKHRYAMALHTDDDHPHVHVVLRAMGHDGKRLHIRRATLRSWREQFAENLREFGVAANATERAVRGLSRVRKSDAIFRAAQRGESSHMRERRSEALGNATANGTRVDPGADRVRATRAAVTEGWRGVAALARSSGDHSLADDIRVFLGGMPPPQSERELWTAIARRSLNHHRAPRQSEPPGLGRQ